MHLQNVFYTKQNNCSIAYFKFQSENILHYYLNGGYRRILAVPVAYGEAVLQGDAAIDVYVPQLPKHTEFYG